ncbi:hypothetical protein BJV74DRAFT_271230 [Russula compacta]|nr:hypothetical protein BJV74DRAFT_271230 [Russula compacta]
MRRGEESRREEELLGIPASIVILQIKFTTMTPRIIFLSYHTVKGSLFFSANHDGEDQRKKEKKKGSGRVVGAEVQEVQIQVGPSDQSSVPDLSQGDSPTIVDRGPLSRLLSNYEQKGLGNWKCFGSGRLKLMMQYSTVGKHRESSSNRWEWRSSRGKPRTRTHVARIRVQCGTNTA